MLTSFQPYLHLGDRLCPLDKGLPRKRRIVLEPIVLIGQVSPIAIRRQIRQLCLRGQAKVVPRLIQSPPEHSAIDRDPYRFAPRLCLVSPSHRLAVTRQGAAHFLPVE